MCLCIPSKITLIDKEKNSCIVDTMGVKREASLDLMEVDTLSIGDYVLIHIGFVMNKIDTEDALTSLEAFEEVLSLMDDEELEETVHKGDNCPNE
jgi:hydrogenase expression/formation protein HypC